MTTVRPALDQPVPDFTASGTGDDPFSLHAARGQWLILYFYPKDDTPGCTTESAAFRDAYKDFTAAGCRIVGISRDNLTSHRRFRERLGLTFELLSDTDEALCGLFDVIRMKNLYGKQVRGIERSTFLIDANGLLRREWRGVKVPGHVEEVLACLQSLQRG